MKHLIWVPLLFLGMPLSAQKLKPSAVPQTVRAAFSRLYPAVQKTKWEKEDGNFEAEFRQEGNTISVVFDVKGAVVETEKQIKVSDLPAPALGYIRDQYKSATVKEAFVINKADGTVNYEAGIKGKDLLFDQSGKFLMIEKE